MRELSDSFRIGEGSVALDQDCTLVARDSIYKDHLVSVIPQLTIEDWTE